MNSRDQSLSRQLEWTQTALESAQALTPATRAKLVEHEDTLQAQKRSLEKSISQPGKEGKSR
jgi:hypothetical protein